MFKLNLLTPERKAVFDQEIIEVSVPGYSGEITILPGHSPMITTLGTGVLKYKVKGQEKAFKSVISWGYCEVTTEGVNVLAEYLQTPEEVSVEATQEIVNSSYKKLVNEVLSDEEYNKTMNDVSKAQSALDMMKH